MKPRKRIAFALLAATALVLGCGALGLFPQEPLRRALERRLAAAISGQATIGRLHVVPWQLSVELHDVALAGPGWRAEAPRLRLVAERGVLSGHLALDSLDIESLRVEGEANGSVAPAAASPTPPITIRQLRVSDGSLRYRDASKGADVTVGGLEASGSIGAGTLTLRSHVIWNRPRPVRLELSATLHVSPTLDVDATTLQAATSKSRVALRGALARAGVFAPDLSAEGDVDLSEAAAFVEEPGLRGRLHVAGHVTGTADAPRVEGTAEGRALVIRGWPVDRVKARIAGSHIEASAQVANLDARRVAREAQLGSDVAGSVSAELAVSGEIGGSFDTQASATARVTASGVSLDVQAGAAGKVRATDRSMDLTWTLTADGGEGLRSEASGRATGVYPPAINAKVAGQADVARLIEGAAGRTTFALELHGPIRKLSGSGHAEAEGLAWNAVAIGPASMRVALRDGASDVDLSAPEWRATAALHLPLSGPLTATLEARETPFERLGRWLPEAVPRDRTLSGRAALALSRSVPRRISVESLKLETRGATLEATGGVGIEESATLDLTARIAADLAALPLAEGWSVAGQLQADVKLGGSRARPHVAGVASATGVSAQGPSLPRLTIDAVRLDIANDTAVLPSTTALLANGSLVFSASMPLSPYFVYDHGPRPAAELHAAWTGLEAAALLAQLGSPALASIQTTLSGRADVTGDLDSLESLHGSAVLDAAAIRVQDFSLDFSPATLKLEHARLSTDGLTARTESGAFTVAGSLDLRRRSLDLAGRGALDLRAFSAFVGSASLGGTADVDMRIAGSLGAPQLSGAASVRNASVRLRDIPEALTDLNARVVFEGERARIEEARASLGGGEVRATGSARLAGTRLEDVSVGLTGRGLALRYPAGLRSQLDAELALTGRSGAFQLAGDVTVLRGFYDIDVAPGAKVVVAETAPSPLLRSVALDLRVSIKNPILIRNRLASLDIDGQLQVRGDLETPAPFGRVEIRNGGKLYLQGRDFTTQGGRLAYEGNWNPAVSFRATRQIRDVSRAEPYDVELTAEGPLDTVQPHLHARPELSENQVAALVATGDITTATSKLGTQLAGQQAAALALGKVSRSFGLDQVSVEPDQLALETDPGSRFTFGKQLSARLSLIYSLSLSDPEERFVQLEARAPHSVSVKGLRNDNGTYSGGVGQKLRFSEGRRTQASAGGPEADRVRLAGVRFEGDRALPEEELRGAVRAKVGRRVSAWEIQEDADRLRARLVERSFIEAQVGGRLEADQAVFGIHSGPRMAWQVDGMPDPPDLKDVIGTALFEGEALEKGRQRVFRALEDRGYLRASVAATSVAERDARRLRFVVTPGPRLEASVSFPGAQLLSRGRLLEFAGGPAAILRSPEDAARGIRSAYRARQHLVTSVGPITVSEPRRGRLEICVPVDEGPAAKIAGVRFEGMSRPEEDLRRAAELGPGAPFTSETLGAAVERLRAYYFGLGYPGVRLSAAPKGIGADVDVAFTITEGSRVEIGAIEIRGLRHSREPLVRERLLLKPGDPLDPRQLAAAERRLLDLGIFVGAAVSASDDSPATITVTLTEDARFTGSYEIRYGNATSTDSQATASQMSALVDGELRNIAGRGIRAGGRYRVGADLREERASLYAPTVRRAGLTLALFQIAEDLEATDPFTGEPFTNVRTQRGLEVQQAIPLPGRWESFVGYHFKRVLSTAFPDPVDVANLHLSVARDTRDNPLDARKGRFLGANLDLAPAGLGSDIRFVKGYAQIFLNRPLTPALSWAHAYRLGLAHPFAGQTLVSSERFQAGGSNSVRGYATDSLGPTDVFGDPAGGDAVLIFNQELRYRYSARFGAALFYDAGNVFASVSDLSFDLRQALGAGLRWNSPIGLLRFDFGFPLFRREGEDAFRFHFALGQSF